MPEEKETVNLGEVTFNQMVTDLFKNPNDILESLDADDVNLIHAGMGIITEAREVCLAIFNNDWVNLKEEVGDLAFYIEAMRQSIDNAYELAPRETATMVASYDVTTFVMQSMNIFEFIKPLVIYRREVDLNNVLAILDELDVLLLGICNTHGVSVVEAMEANKIKLLTKRYPNGYSDEAANNRADKDE